jgi:hypothetical protein
MASDFQDEGFDKSMKITGRKHDLVNILINDKLENELPAIGLAPLKDAETGKTVLVDTSSPKVRKAYQLKRNQRKELLREKFMRMKVDSVEVATNESYIKPLVNFFRQRMHRY